MLVTLEGIDGTGKSTLLAGLKPLLADLDPVYTREPGATWVGESVRRANRGTDRSGLRGNALCRGPCGPPRHRLSARRSQNTGS